MYNEKTVRFIKILGHLFGALLITTIYGVTVKVIGRRVEYKNERLVPLKIGRIAAKHNERQVPLRIGRIAAKHNERLEA